MPHAGIEMTAQEPIDAQEMVEETVQPKPTAQGPKRKGWNKYWKIMMVVPIVVLHTFTKINTQYPKTLTKPIYTSFGWSGKVAKYQLLNTCFQLAQAVTAIYGYGMVQEWGYRVAFPSFAIITAVGTFMCSYGYSVGSDRLFTLIIIGRFVMGCGIAPIKVSYQSLTKKWIKDQNLSLAMTAVLFATGAALIICSFIPDLLVALVPGVTSENVKEQPEAAKVVRAFGWFITIAQGAGILIAFWIIRCDGKLTENNPDVAMEYKKKDLASDDSAHGENLFVRLTKETFRTARSANRMYWLLLAMLLCNNVALKPFNNFVALPEFKILGDYGRYAIAVNGGSLLLSPFMGTLVDRFRHRTVFLAVCTSIVCACSFIIQFFNSTLQHHHWLSWCIITVYYASHTTFASAFWPSVMCSGIEKTKIGFALGIMNSCDALSSGVLSYVLKAMNVEQQSMCLFTTLAVVCAMLLLQRDRRASFTLDGHDAALQNQVEALESGSIPADTTPKPMWEEIQEKVEEENRLNPEGVHMQQVLNDISVRRTSDGRLSSVSDCLALNLARAVSVEESCPDM